MNFFRKPSIWTGVVLVGLAAILYIAYFFDPAVSAQVSQYTEKNVHWFSLLPPLLAVGFALLLRKVVVALFLAIVVGVGLLHSFHPVVLIKKTAVDYVWNNTASEFGLMFIGFVFALIGMISVINKAGGTQGLVNIFKRKVMSARRVCLAAAGMGLAIFFDDYTNTILIGSTMRGLTDAMRVSREKLAYIVDSTAAPIAGLAVISTWIGFEVEQLQYISESLNLGLGGYNIFFQMVPLRFYCILTIVFVLANAYLRRDFGPMLKAERRAEKSGKLFEKEDDQMLTADFAETQAKEGISCRWYNAVIPVLTVIIVLIGGVLIGSSFSPAMADKSLNIFSWQTWYNAFVGIGQVENGIPTVLCIAALSGSLVVALMVTFQRLLSPAEILHAWFKPWKIVFVIAVFVIFAWTIRQVCDELGAAYYLLAATKGHIPAVWIPLLTFGISAAIAFSIGTSWGAMAILIPTMAPLAFNMGGLPIFILSMAAVLDGAIFGDHCSPISDTTVLSSIASGCDHIDHVKTQIPYALVTMVIAGLAGYLPVALGLPVVISYIVGIVAILAVMFLFGRKPELD